MEKWGTEYINGTRGGDTHINSTAYFAWMAKVDGEKDRVIGYQRNTYYADGRETHVYYDLKGNVEGVYTYGSAIQTTYNETYISESNNSVESNNINVYSSSYAQSGGGAPGYFMENGTLGNFVNLIYSNSKQYNTEGYTELSGFAVTKNGKNSYFINSKVGNTRSLSNNYEGYLRSKGYSILFQVHSHGVNGPSYGDNQAMMMIGADVFTIDMTGDIWQTGMSPNSFGEWGKVVGNVNNIGPIFNSYGIKR
jgi:hypothetical protein